MNKSNVWIIVGAIGAVFAAGFIAARISTKTETPTVQSQDSEAARLESEALAADAVAKRSAADAAEFRIFEQQRRKELDRLEILSANDRLYDVEKMEICQIVERIAADYPDIYGDYTKTTGRIENLSTWVRRIREYDGQKSLRLQQKAVDDARIAAEKRLECLKYAASKR